MSERDTPSLLQDILEAIGNIKAFTQDLIFDAYQSERRRSWNSLIPLPVLLKWIVIKWVINGQK